MTHGGMLDHALAYAARGIPVLPVRPGDKAPNRNLVAHGKDSATLDTDLIREWWRRCPTGNIGLRPPDGVLVLDVDVQNGGGIANLGAIPETRKARTGSGGWHVWMRHRFTGHPRGKLEGAAGIDLKTSRGYLIAPPSVHRNGNVYRWSCDAAVARLPVHLRTRVEYPEVQRMQRFTATAGRVEGLVRKVAESVPGNRNAVLFWAAMRMFEQGTDRAELDLLRAAALSVGLTEMEIERTLRSAERRCA